MFGDAAYDLGEVDSHTVFRAQGKFVRESATRYSFVATTLQPFVSAGPDERADDETDLTLDPERADNLLGLDNRAD